MTCEQFKLLSPYHASVTEKIAGLRHLDECPDCLAFIETCQKQEEISDVEKMLIRSWAENSYQQMEYYARVDPEMPQP